MKYLWVVDVYCSISCSKLKKEYIVSDEDKQISDIENVVLIENGYLETDVFFKTTLISINVLHLN